MDQDIKSIRLHCQNEAISFCISQTCNSISPMCQNKHCLCNQYHKDNRCCPKIDVQIITDTLLKKIKTINKLEDLVNQSISNCCKIITRQGQQIKQNIISLVFNKDQQKLRNLMQSKQIESITSNLIKNIYKSLNSQINNDDYYEKLQSQFVSFNLIISQSISQITKALKQMKKQKEYFPIDKDLKHDIAFIDWKSVVVEKGSQRKSILNPQIKKSLSLTTQLTKSVLFCEQHQKQEAPFRFSNIYLKTKNIEFLQNGKKVRLSSQLQPHFIIIDTQIPQLSLMSFKFSIKKLPICSTMYYGVCDINKSRKRQFIFNQIASTGSLLLKQNGNIINSCNINQQPKINQSNLSYQQGDQVQFHFVPWSNGIQFFNKQRNIKVFCQYNVTSSTRICVVLQSLGSQVEIKQ